MLSSKKKHGIKVTGFVMFLIIGTFGITTAQTIINGDPAKLLDTLNYRAMIKPSIQYLSCDKVVSVSGDELSFSNDTLRLVDRSDENNIIQYKIPKYLLKQLKYNTKSTLSKLGSGYAVGSGVTIGAGLLIGTWIIKTSNDGWTKLGGFILTLVSFPIGLGIGGPIFAAGNAQIPDYNYSFSVSPEIINSWNLLHFLIELKSKSQVPYLVWEKKFKTPFMTNSIKENEEITADQLEFYEYKKCDHFLKYTDSSGVNVVRLDVKNEKQLKWELFKYEIITSYLENDNNTNLFSQNIYKEIDTSDFGLIDDPEFFRFQTKTVFPVKYVFYHISEKETYLLVCYNNPKKAIINAIDKNTEKRMLDILIKKGSLK